MILTSSWQRCGVNGGQSTVVWLMRALKLLKIRVRLLWQANALCYSVVVFQIEEPLGCMLWQGDSEVFVHICQEPLQNLVVVSWQKHEGRLQLNAPISLSFIWTLCLSCSSSCIFFLFAECIELKQCDQGIEDLPGFFHWPYWHCSHRPHLLPPPRANHWLDYWPQPRRLQQPHFYWNVSSWWRRLRARSFDEHSNISFRSLSWWGWRRVWFLAVIFKARVSGGYFWFGFGEVAGIYIHSFSLDGVYIYIRSTKKAHKYLSKACTWILVSRHLHSGRTEVTKQNELHLFFYIIVSTLSNERMGCCGHKSTLFYLLG